ncbi:helix-turn-helix domain-containing protein [Fodinibius halophilus]|uniref:AraC family transcriptional regulator n=1 Tax=Fodinibius halophilus TaxID=1736908 RepID=A0A6M1TBX3_9BACT|nr:helix-turn-helix domain-containing protein [Fodinibius halophilus]NGP87742.1 AraC family transcriptional regulator [Fodinibius halophilus]
MGKKDQKFGVKSNKKQLPGIIEGMLLCIYRHLFNHQLTVAFVKKECDINGNNWAGKFKFYLGVPPKKFINLLRVKASVKLLDDNSLDGLTIQRIAMHVGYRNSSTFVKAFKRIKGVPPGKWRSENKIS